ncbi:hypothetical protein [Desulfobulbus sp.]|uniref:hypothetical protein n=1 Tax=Desulfobulbus sp. TaxID=895 RepID=UPI00286FA84C|nr:hypothetical protein [Desulfobulbus sp.]
MWLNVEKEIFHSEPFFAHRSNATIPTGEAFGQTPTVQNRDPEIEVSAPTAGHHRPAVAVALQPAFFQ